MNKKNSKLTALFLPLILLFALSCEDCQECPTCPETPTPGSYYVYIADDQQQAPCYIWVVDSKTDSLIDSIFTPGDNISIMDITPDGNYLAAFMYDIDSVYIFDLDSKSVLINFPGEWPFFSPDGQYLLIADIHTEQLFKYQVSDWSLIASDTMPFFPHNLFYNSPYICGDKSGAKEYVIYDYETMSTVKVDSLVRPDGSTPQLLDMIPSFDDKYLYFTSRPNKVFKFEIESSSIVDSTFIIYGGYRGSLKHTPDGRYLLVSESTQWPDLPIGNLLIIEPESFNAYRRIQTWGLNPYYPFAPAMPGNIAVTPDGIKAYCGRGSMVSDLPLSFNLVDLRATTVKNVREGCTAMCIAVGNEIKK